MGLAASESGCRSRLVRLAVLAPYPRADRSELEGAPRAPAASVALAPAVRACATRTGAFDEARAAHPCAWCAGRRAHRVRCRSRPLAAPWERAGELALDTYLASLPVIDAPIAAFPRAGLRSQRGAARAVALRIVVARGAPDQGCGAALDEIRALGDVLEFARSRPLADETD